MSLLGLRELPAATTQQLNHPGWNFLQSRYVMQKGLNLSCQCTCRNGESTGALTLKKHEINESKFQTWIGSMNLSGTFHLKLESRPASRNFPDSANLEDKKGRSDSPLLHLSFAFMLKLLMEGIKIFASILICEVFDGTQRKWATKLRIGAYLICSFMYMFI